MTTLGEMLLARPRATVEFDVGLLWKDLEGSKIAFRVLSKAEVDRATSEAHASLLRLYGTKDALDGALAVDPSILEDERVVQLLSMSCRDASDTSKPAFPSARWMSENMTPAELAVLLHRHNEVMKNAGTLVFQLSDETIEALAARCAMFSETDAPDVGMLRLTREVLVEVAIRFAMKLQQARAALP